MASALEHYVNTVRSLTTSGNIRDLCVYLNESVDLLARNGNILDNVLETLNIQEHSLGVLYILVAKFSDLQLSTDADSLIRLVREFTSLCNGEHVRSAPNHFYELYHKFANYLVKNKLPTIRGIAILTQAVEKIRLFDSQLTPIHADLCLLCLCSKVFKLALPFLDTDITDIVTTDDQNQDSKYFLLFYYYGGMIYTAMKNYERALYFFEVGVTTPSLAMSHIMLESYKKYILVSLIGYGKMLPIPKYASQVVARFIKPLSHAYNDLSNVYATGQSDEVRSVMLKYHDVFVRDSNLGLVKQVVGSLYKKNIQRLTKTFLTLSLTDVASRVQLATPSDAERYIFNMIKSGEIFATINQKDGMVIFKDDPEKYNSPGIFLRVQQDVNRVIELNKKLSRMEEEIILNPTFVKKAAGNQDEDISHSKTYSGDRSE